MKPEQRKIIADINQVKFEGTQIPITVSDAFKQEIISTVEAQCIMRRDQAFKLLIDLVPICSVSDDQSRSASVEDPRILYKLQTLRILGKSFLESGRFRELPLEDLSIPGGFLQLFRLLGIEGDEWKNSGFIRNRATKAVEDGGLGLDHACGSLLKGIALKVTKKFGSYREFVAKMEGKDSAELTIPNQVDACKDPESLRQLLLSNDIVFTSARGFLKQQNGRGQSTNIVRSVLEKFAKTTQLVLAFLEKRWLPDEHAIEKIKDYSKEEFLLFFKQLGIEGYWRDAPRLRKETENSILNFGTPAYLPLPEFLLGIYAKFRSYDKFIQWQDQQKELRGRWPSRVAQCKTRLDFIVLFADEGIPGDKWENSEWLSSTSRLSVEEGGINNGFMGLVSAIRNDKRFGRSYPQFVAWMYDSEVQESMRHEVARWQTPKDADDLFKKLEIPKDCWIKIDRMSDLAILRRQEGKESKSIWGVITGIRMRWKNTRQYYAWHEGKEKADNTILEKVTACKSPSGFLTLFKAEGIPDLKWRNSYWMGKFAQLSFEEGGIDKSLRSLRNILIDRFKTWRRFLEYMDGVPETGITNKEEALAIIHSESNRLNIPLGKLLNHHGQNSILAHWRRSPALIRVLQFFADQETASSSDIAPTPISVTSMLDALHLEYENLAFHKQNSDLNEKDLSAYNHEVRQSFAPIIERYGEITDEEGFKGICNQLQNALATIPTRGLPERKVLQRINDARRHARATLTVDAHWELEPLRLAHKLTIRGLSALNAVREQLGMEKKFSSNTHFLRESISSQEKTVLAAIAAELGPAAVAEYLCALYPDRFPYSYRTVQNLRAWLGGFETNAPIGIDQIPVALLSMPELAMLRQVLFNRLRDRYQSDYQQGLDVVVAKLESAKTTAKHRQQQDFVQNLIDYFTNTENRTHPARLKKLLRGGEFPAKHQKIAITEIEERRACLNADEMGGGKTGSTIASFEYLREQGKATRALIICPAQIVSVWKKALSDDTDGCFEGGKKPNAVFIESGLKDWEKGRNADYVVMSIEMARHRTKGRDNEDLAKELGADFFVLDEAHNVKNTRGEDTDRIFRISQAESVVRGYTVLLTGTPIPNTIRDLASQIRLLYTGRQDINGLDLTDLNHLANSLMRNHPLMARNLLLPRMLRRTSEQSLPIDVEMHREMISSNFSPVEQAVYDSILNCPFYEVTEKIRMLRQTCLRSETKYLSLCQQIDQFLSSNTKDGKPVKITVAGSLFAKGVTRDFNNDHNPETSNQNEYIVGRLRQDYDGLARVFVLDGNNSSQLESIIKEFKVCIEPAILVTLTSVAGEGLDLSFSSHSALLSPTQTVSEEDQWGKRQHRKGQEYDVYLGILQIGNTIEQGIAEYAQRKSHLVEEVLHGRPLSAYEEELLAEDGRRIRNSGFLAYEAKSPKQKLMWIFNRIYGRGKKSVHEFFELDNGKYARDLAALYLQEEETSYQGNNARLITALLEPHLQNGEIKIADIGCGCLTMQRMLSSRRSAKVWSSDICPAMIEAGTQLIKNSAIASQIEISPMDELSYADESIDVAILSLALQYTRHNPRKTTGSERINALRELNRILKKDGTAIISLPTRALEDMEAFKIFCSALERHFGFEIDKQRTNLARSVDNETEKPFEAYIITLKKVRESSHTKLPTDDLLALDFKRFQNTNGTIDEPVKSEAKKHRDDTNSAYHEKFMLGDSPIEFSPQSPDETAIKYKYVYEKEKYTHLVERIDALLSMFGSINNIPEEMLLSISIENVDKTDQPNRDKYFRFLLDYYGNVQRIPIEEISKNSPVILIRGQSKKGPYLCLARIGKEQKACGYGKRYFYQGESVNKVY